MFAIDIGKIWVCILMLLCRVDAEASADTNSNNGVWTNLGLSVEAMDEDDCSVCFGQAVSDRYSAWTVRLHNPTSLELGLRGEEIHWPCEALQYYAALGVGQNLTNHPLDWVVYHHPKWAASQVAVNVTAQLLIATNIYPASQHSFRTNMMRISLNFPKTNYPYILTNVIVWPHVDAIHRWQDGALDGGFRTMLNQFSDPMARGSPLIADLLVRRAVPLYAGTNDSPVMGCSFMPLLEPQRGLIIQDGLPDHIELRPGQTYKGTIFLSRYGFFGAPSNSVNYIFKLNNEPQFRVHGYITAGQ